VAVKIDTDMISDAFLEEFSEYMWEVDSVDAIAKHIAYCTAVDTDPEGVGCLKRRGETEEDQMKKYGFNSNCYAEDTETEIE